MLLNQVLCEACPNTAGCYGPCILSFAMARVFLAKLGRVWDLALHGLLYCSGLAGTLSVYMTWSLN